MSLEEQQIQEPLFEIETPIGLEVRTTQNHWELMIRKHPEVIDLFTKKRENYCGKNKSHT